MGNSDFKSYTPEELKKLTIEQATEYCDEVRKFLIDNVSVTGGHLASNLGVCELSVALVRVFDLPRDKVIYDVGHQSYVHKILTGRSDKFNTIRKLDGLSGFTKISESEYDAFGAGHSSTSVSAALGFAKAAKMSGDNEHCSIAVIGDGAFTGGMAYEGLNNCDEGDNIIIILNENEMSISKNVGKLSRYFLKIRSRKSYFSLKHTTEKVLRRIPGVGAVITHALQFFKMFMRRLVTNSNMSEQLGIKYFGPADGNDLETVELLLEEAKRHKGPCFVHLCTVKGKGYAPAEENPSSYHSISGASSLSKRYDKMSGTLGKKLSEMADSDRRICAVTAAMGEGVGLCEFEKNHADRFFDVGIAEEHALTFSAALSAAGFLPCVALYSTFFQRAYDQYIHDVALQNLRIILALDRAGFVGEDGPTHHGVFDVSMLLNVPNTQIFSPICSGELEKCLDIAAESECSTVIRYPKIIRSDVYRNKFRSYPKDELYNPHKGADILIVTYGSLTANSVEACEILCSKGITCAVYRVARLKPFDIETFKSTLSEMEPKFIYVLEEGMKVGGFGEYLSSVVNGYDFYIKAVEDEFVTFGNTEQLYDRYGFSSEKVVKNIIELSENVCYESGFVIV